MDFLTELETMVANALASDLISEVDIGRWQKLFGLTTDGARHAIEQHRADFGRNTISDEHWNIIAVDQETLGYDKEAYEYFLGQKPHIRLAAVDTKGSLTNCKYLIKLEGPIATPTQLQNALELTECPTVYQSTNEDDGQGSSFCTVDAAARARLLDWTSHHHPFFRPTIVRLKEPSKKLLSPFNLAPFLGRESTLPHLRPTSIANPPRPLPNELPVWYFFYGTLADPAVLQMQLGLTTLPEYKSAKIYGGRLTTWGGKYNALVDAQPADAVEGMAYCILDYEQEQALMAYETDAYEVVRCNIVLTEEGRTIHGLVFRFCGDEQRMR